MELMVSVTVYCASGSYWWQQTTSHTDILYPLGVKSCFLLVLCFRIWLTSASINLLWMCCLFFSLFGISISLKLQYVFLLGWQEMEWHMWCDITLLARSSLKHRLFCWSGICAEVLSEWRHPGLDTNTPQFYSCKKWPLLSIKAILILVQLIYACFHPYFVHFSLAPSLHFLQSMFAHTGSDNLTCRIRPVDFEKVLLLTFDIPLSLERVQKLSSSRRCNKKVIPLLSQEYSRSYILYKWIRYEKK